MMTTILSEGDARYAVGDQVNIVIVLIDANGTSRVHLALASILTVQTELVIPNTMNIHDPYTFISSDAKQFQFAKKKPPVIPHPAVATSSPNTKKELKRLQRRVTGYDVQIISEVPWTINDVPAYYYPQTVELRSCMFNPYDGAVSIVFIPTRHILGKVNDENVSTKKNIECLNRFYGKAPYNWLILHKHKKGDEVCDIVCEVIDFGVDYDNQMKLVVTLRNRGFPSFFKEDDVDQNCFDNYLFHGAFAEVARRHSNLELYKIPFSAVNDIYDEQTLGKQTYLSVLKHHVCDKMSRFRVKTIKLVIQQTEDEQKREVEDNELSKSNKKKPFFYGFTDEGYHFSKTNRMVLNLDFDEQQWLGLRKAKENERNDYIVKKSFVVYGRVIFNENTGQKTLEWCSPPPGFDLLRVYLATSGKSPIFKQLSQEDILKKMKDKDGNETLASQLFAGIIDRNATNKAIEFVKKNLIWSK